MKYTVPALMILFATTGVVHAQTLTTDTEVERTHEQILQNKKMNKDGSVSVHESVSHEHQKTQTDNPDAIAPASGEAKEVIPTGAVRSDEIERTDTGRIIQKQ